MRATYPAYLARPAEGLAVGEPARVPQGTVIEIAGRASTALRDVRLGSVRRTRSSLHVNDHAFEGRFEARKTGRYAWVANGTTGPIADVPLPLELEVVPDSAPRVELVSPATRHDRRRRRQDHAARDRDGRSRPRARRARDVEAGERARCRSRRPRSVWRRRRRTCGTAATVLDLAPRGLKPGDALHVKIVATDNSPWAQHGESRELLLKIPTMEERRAIARASMDSAVSQAKSAAAAEKSLEQRTSDAARDRSQRGSPAGRAEQRERRERQAGLDELRRGREGEGRREGSARRSPIRSSSSSKRPPRSSSSSSRRVRSTAASRGSFRKRSSCCATRSRPSCMAQMKKLEDATQQLSREQSQQSLKDLQAMQQKLREQLEKSAEMLKRAALEGAMQTLKDEAKEIARSRQSARRLRAREIAGRSQKAEAKQLADRSQRFEDELKKLQERLEKEKADAGATGTRGSAQARQRVRGVDASGGRPAETGRQDAADGQGAARRQTAGR